MAQTMKISKTPMTDEQILAVAPSVFAENAAPTVSHRYEFISTKACLDLMREAGFMPHAARQSTCRDESGRTYTKHQIRFRSDAARAFDDGFGDVFPEISLTNSHLGTGSYIIDPGFFRAVCTNGMTVGDSLNIGLRVRHSKKAAQGVVEAAMEIIGEVPMMVANVKRMQVARVERETEVAMAREALALRWTPGEEPISTDQLLVPRRIEDRDPTVWNVLNRLQENMIRGGLQMARAEGITRRSSTRPIRSIQTDRKINRGLWDIAQKALATV